MHRNEYVRTITQAMLLMAVIAVSSAETLGAETPEPTARDAVISVSGKRHYEPTWESLAQHGAAPGWYRDAVFGIYFHWGIYSVPAYGGEKYPREMYKLNSGVYKHHCDTYGDPTQFGYHDLIPMFKAERWDPNRWAKVFKDAGADFAGPIAEHHDGFAMWDTQYDQYNSMDMGPRRDIVGEMARAVRKQQMKVVVTFHHMRWDYYDAGRKLCPEGVGVNDPKLSGLYGCAYEAATPEAGSWLAGGRIERPKHQAGNPIFESFREEGYNKIMEVIDKYQPDQLQSDGFTLVRLGQDRVRKILAHHFNTAEKSGREVVVSRGYDSHHPYSPSEMWGKEVMISRIIPLSCSVQNSERHFPKIPLRSPCPNLWQATTPVPGFSYSYVASQEDKTPDQVEASVDVMVDGMVDVKCKNGVTLMSVAPKPDGTLPDSLVKMLNKLGDWMRVNKEALHGADCRIPCEAGTLRFTQKGHDLYAIDLEEPSTPVVIPGVTPMPGSTIRMLGSDDNLAWHQDDGNVVIDELPDPLPCDYSWVFRIRVSEATEEAQQASARNGINL
jgi:alpha-L-fucosidase